MFNFLLILLALSLLPACGKQPQKLVFDPRTHIDCLPEDEYGSDRERLHAKDVARFHDEANQRMAQAAQKQSQPNSLASDEQVRLFEAKLSDVPIPMGAKPIKQYFDAAKIDSREMVLGYISEQSCEELALFYVAYMEQFDWRMVSSFSGIEQLFVFEKPAQTCVVSLRAQEGWFYQGGHTQIIIYLNESQKGSVA
jgi:hypothetical protein